MNPLKGDKLFFLERTTSRVSAAWKVLHVVIFFAIAANAFINSILVGKLFIAFQYNCIIFCTNITFEQEIIPVEIPQIEENEDIIQITEDPDQLPTTLALIETTTINVPPKNKTIDVAINERYYSDILQNKTDYTTVFRNDTVFIYSDRVQTIMVHSKVSLRKSRFPSNFLCNLTLCTVLMTFIWALFFGVLMIMCSKGGRGYSNDILSRPQLLIYPILLTSLVLVILNLVVSNIFDRGLNAFCENFEIFTQTKRCSPLMDQFTVQFAKVKKSFYTWYLVTTYSFYAGVALICAQFLLTVFRVLCVVDYQLYAVQLEDKSQPETETIQVSRRNSADETTELTNI